MNLHPDNPTGPAPLKNILADGCVFFLLILGSFLFLLKLSAINFGMPLSEVWQELSRGLYWPNHNYFHVKKLNGLNLNALIYIIFAASLWLTYTLKLSLNHLCQRPHPDLLRKTVLATGLFFFALALLLQTYQQAQTFADEWASHRGKTTEEKYQFFLPYKRDYVFAQFCHKKIPGRSTVGFLADWYPAEPATNQAQARWAYLTYFLYPLKLTTDTAATEFLIAVYAQGDPQSALPENFEIIDRFDSFRFIAKRKGLFP